MKWTEEHGPDQLYNKFRIIQISSGEEITGKDEFVFVLRPERDREAYAALVEYASRVSHRSPKLAQQILTAMIKIRQRNES